MLEFRRGHSSVPLSSTGILTPNPRTPSLCRTLVRLCWGWVSTACEVRGPPGRAVGAVGGGVRLGGRRVTSGAMRGARRCGGGQVGQGGGFGGQDGCSNRTVAGIGGLGGVSRCRASGSAVVRLAFRSMMGWGCVESDEKLKQIWGASRGSVANGF